MESIKTLGQFAGLINRSEEWLPEFEEIIEENGWRNQTGDNQWSICSDGYNKVVFNDECLAILVPDNESVPRRLAALRQKRGMTVRDLAEATGINPSNLSLIETGKRKPQTDTLQRILDALGAEMIIKEKEG